MKYIDADKLIAEIEKLYEIARNASYNGEVEGEMTAYDKILAFIPSLQQEQPELDIDTLREWSMRYAPDIRQCIEATAYHFWNMALNARK